MSGGIVISPLLPLAAILVFGAVGLALVVITLFRGSPGALTRSLVLGLLILALLNPRGVQEEREAQTDIALVVVDRTDSQRIGERRKHTEQALEAVRQSLARFDDLEVRVSEVVDGTGDEAEDGTQLFSAVDRAAGDIPNHRFAGAIVITDGQAHDRPDKVAPANGPVHVLLTGQRGESDRRLVIEQAPSYGIVGNNITITYRVEDRRPKTSGTFGSDLARVTISDDDREIASAQVPVGRSDSFTVKIDHAGLSVLRLEVAPVEGELSQINNRALVSINGVRDRLRVLLVSGQPHPGERTWRNLLKSDPSVDLVHFTILRPPEKDDFTPLNELALIAFPVRELFETKLHEFDLIVFDRYVVRDVLPPPYMRNISDYVNTGGALLLALGPEFASIRSLFQTPLGHLMPATPTGQVMEHGFRPVLTTVGHRHPVSAALPGGNTLAGDDPRWGRWFRRIGASARRGVTILDGADGEPLLILDRIGQGRVAQMLSDHIWLWARGFEGGGPQGELLRRLSHWLMKEPDLEEESLRAEARQEKLVIRRHSLDEAAAEITVTAPSGDVRTYTMPKGAAGADELIVEAPETGLYRIDDGAHTALTASGTLNPLEFADLRATDEILRPLTEATGGGLNWITEGIPDLRRTRPGRDSSGRGWLGLTANKASVITGLTQIPLLPAFVFLPLILLGLMAAWWREGR